MVWSVQDKELSAWEQEIYALKWQKANQIKQFDSLRECFEREPSQYLLGQMDFCHNEATEMTPQLIILINKILESQKAMVGKEIEKKGEIHQQKGGHQEPRRGIPGGG